MASKVHAGVDRVRIGLIDLAADLRPERPDQTVALQTLRVALERIDLLREAVAIIADELQPGDDPRGPAPALVRSEAEIRAHGGIGTYGHVVAVHQKGMDEIEMGPNHHSSLRPGKTLIQCSCGWEIETDQGAWDRFAAHVETMAEARRAGSDTAATPIAGKSTIGTYGHTVVKNIVNATVRPMRTLLRCACGWEAETDGDTWDLFAGHVQAVIDLVASKPTTWRVLQCSGAGIACPWHVVFEKPDHDAEQAAIRDWQLHRDVEHAGGGRYWWNSGTSLRSQLESAPGDHRHVAYAALVLFVKDCLRGWADDGDVLGQEIADGCAAMIRARLEGLQARYDRQLAADKAVGAELSDRLDSARYVVAGLLAEYRPLLALDEAVEAWRLGSGVTEGR